MKSKPYSLAWGVRGDWLGLGSGVGVHDCTCVPTTPPCCEDRGAADQEEAWDLEAASGDGGENAHIYSTWHMGVHTPQCHA